VPLREVGRIVPPGSLFVDRRVDPFVGGELTSRARDLTERVPPDLDGAASTARSAQSSRGRGLRRRSTATSCSSTSSSAFFDADDRPSKTSQMQSRTRIR
jgi:hypothetical protein